MKEQDFSCRSYQRELMDDDAIGYEDFRHCLRDIELVNAFSLGYRPTLHWLKKTLGSSEARRPISVLDVGSGGGGMLRRIWKYSQRVGLEVHLTGIDLNPWAKRSAEDVTPRNAPIRYETADIFSIDQDRHADFIISSVFTHHLSDGEVVKFLRWMDRHARRGWFINDIHRHPVPFLVIHYATRIAWLDPMVRNDGPISVTRAFTAKDWRRLIAEAEIPPQRVSIDWYFPFRYCVAGRIE